MGRVEGKVAIVTGAARGLGKAIAQLLAREGAKVVVTDILEDGGKEAAEEIRREGGKAIFIKHDVASEDSWSAVVEKTLSEFGKLDILVNNAGIQLIKEIEKTSLEEWRGLMSVNLDGVFLGTKYAIGAMKESGGGSIINISSAAGIIGTADDTAAYCASKGAVRLFSKAAALECSKAGHNYNIRVNSVHPGVIETAMVASMMSQDKELKKRLESNMPIGFLGRPIDIAYAVLYLASEESRLVTGAELVVDGGWTAS
jgi:NAD(P)-dependent dehydrogenase (short-subunit alcohol dehydrogenase family)